MQRTKRTNVDFDKTDDFVAIEIAAALAREILVIPVLVDGTHMPKASELPASLKPFALRNAIQVRNTNFGNDAEVLVAKICEALGRDRRSFEVISQANYAFSQATDNLIALYRNFERRTAGSSVHHYCSPSNLFVGYH